MGTAFATNIAPLEGYFQKEGGLLKGKRGFDLLIRNRSASKTTTSKTSQFLLKIEPDGSRKYVSSLWQTRRAGVHEFEFQGIRYGVDLNSSVPFIHPLRESKK